jgi:hypothetical protein
MIRKEFRLTDRPTECRHQLNASTMRSIECRRRREEWGNKQHHYGSAWVRLIWWWSSIAKIECETTKKVSFSDRTQDFMLVTRVGIFATFLRKQINLYLASRSFPQEQHDPLCGGVTKKGTWRSKRSCSDPHSDKRRKTAIVPHRKRGGGHRKKQETQNHKKTIVTMIVSVLIQSHSINQSIVSQNRGLPPIKMWESTYQVLFFDWQRQHLSNGVGVGFNVMWTCLDALCLGEPCVLFYVGISMNLRK